MPKRLTLVCALALLVAGGAGPAGAQGGAAADLKDPAGQTLGTATFTEEAGQVRLVVEISGLAPGKHGLHVHAVGRCEPPAFATAGGHFNPLNRKHGLESAEGPHAGDLPNLEADAAGRARYQATTDRLTIADGPRSMFDADGSALVVHEKEDDQRTDPTGNSAGRVACGVIVRR